MKKRLKHKDQVYHAQTRARQRLGVHFGPKQNKELVSEIQKGTLKFLLKESNTRTHYEATIDGEKCRVVYDKKHKTIVTVLRKDMEL